MNNTNEEKKINPNSAVQNVIRNNAEDQDSEEKLKEDKTVEVKQQNHMILRDRRKIEKPI